MNIARIIMIVLFAMDLGINLAKHKEKREGSAAEYNFWTATISIIIQVIILYFGGFWG